MKSLVDAIKEHTPEKTYLRMTLREYAAVAAMQGICAGYQNRCLFDKNDADGWAEEALCIADALIAKLEEGK